MDIQEAINAGIALALRGVHTSLPGVVVSYDAARQVADVQPVVRVPAAPEDGAQDYQTSELMFDEHPTIPSVPVRWPSAGGFTFVGKLVPGDHVDLHFHEQDPSAWRSTGQMSDPLFLARHALSFAFCTLGARPAPQAIPDGQDAASRPYVGLEGTTSQVGFTSGDITIGKGATDFVALASKVLARLQEIVTAYNSHVHTTGMPAGPTSTPVTAGTPVPLLVTTPVASVAATKVKAL